MSLYPGLAFTVRSYGWESQGLLGVGSRGGGRLQEECSFLLWKAFATYASKISKALGLVFLTSTLPPNPYNDKLFQPLPPLLGHHRRHSMVWPTT